MCGHQEGLPGPYATSKRMAYVHFVSDETVSHNGFRLEWVVNGCGGELRKDSESFSSPNYPNVYPLAVECYWYITTALGTSVELHILEYDLEGQATCRYDALTVYGGRDTTSPQLTQLCMRRTTNVTVTSTGNHMLVHFKSDGSIRGKGFSARYQTKPSGIQVQGVSGNHSSDFHMSYVNCIWHIDFHPFCLCMDSFLSQMISLYKNKVPVAFYNHC